MYWQGKWALIGALSKGQTFSKKGSSAVEFLMIWRNAASLALMRAL